MSTMFNNLNKIILKQTWKNINNSITLESNGLDNFLQKFRIVPLSIQTNQKNGILVFFQTGQSNHLNYL